MKKLVFILILLKCFDVNAQWNGVVTGTSHKTPTGKYPIYFDDGGGSSETWTEADQKDYDEKMSATIKKLCSDRTTLGGLEKQYTEADSADGANLNSHPEIGNKIEDLKTDITKLSDIVVKGTGRSASSYPCE